MFFPRRLARWSSWLDGTCFDLSPKRARLHAKEAVEEAAAWLCSDETRVISPPPPPFSSLFRIVDLISQKTSFASWPLVPSWSLFCAFAFSDGPSLLTVLFLFPLRSQILRSGLSFRCSPSPPPFTSVSSWRENSLPIPRMQKSWQKCPLIVPRRQSSAALTTTG